MVSVALLCLALIRITFAMLRISVRCPALHRLALLDIAWNCLVVLGIVLKHVHCVALRCLAFPGIAW